MSEETRVIKRVGYFSTGQAQAEDCERCHNATAGTVIIDDLCLDCFIEKNIDGAIIDKFQSMCEESLDPATFANFEIVKETLEGTRHIPKRKKICCRCLKAVEGEWCDVKCTTTGKPGVYCAECFAFFSAELESEALNQVGNE